MPWAPTGAKDEQLQPLLQNGQVATTPAAPEALPNGYHSAQEEAPESADYARSNGGSAEPLGRSASEHIKPVLSPSIFVSLSAF